MSAPPASQIALQVWNRGLAPGIKSDGDLGDAFLSEELAPSRDPPPRKPKPSEQASDTRPEPLKPRRSPVVEVWEAAFNVGGRRGLQKAWYKYAHEGIANADKLKPWESKNVRKSWQHFLKDEEKGTDYVIQLLHTLPDEIILALLRGDLAYQMQTPGRVASFVERFMKLEPMPKATGIYMNIPRNFDGRWLDSNDMSRLLDIVENYCKVDADGKPRSDQTLIDGQLSSWQQKGDHKVRYRPGTRAPQIWAKWIAKSRETHCINSIDDSEPFISCPTEVGWATNVKERCGQHINNSGTNYMFGLLNAILRMDPSQDGFKFPKPLQLLLFPVWKRDEVLVRCAEIVGSLLCSSYWYLGGLNPLPAGTMTFLSKAGKAGVLIPPKSTDDAWKLSAQLFEKRLRFQKPVIAEIAKARHWEDVVYRATMIEDLEAEYEKVQEALKKKEAERDAAKKAQEEEMVENTIVKEEIDEQIPSTQQDAILEHRMQLLDISLDKAEARRAEGDAFMASIRGR